MSKTEEKINSQDLLSLLEEAKAKVKEAGGRCDTMHMSPKVYDLVVAELTELFGEKTLISNITCMGLKLVKSKLVPENTVFFSQQGKIQKNGMWNLENLK